MPRLRLHKSSFVVGLIVVLLFVLIGIPGRVVTGWAGQGRVSAVFEHGWPWIFIRRETVHRENPTTWLMRSIEQRFRSRWGIPWLSAENWRFWESDATAVRPRWVFDPVNFSWNITNSLVLLAGMIAAWEWRRRRRAKLFAFRFGLRGLLLAIAVVGAVLGWLTYVEREYQRETALIDREADRSIGPMEATRGDVGNVCVAPLWLRALIGERFFPEYFWRASAVDIAPERGDKTELMCAEIAQLDYVTRISIDGHPRHRFRFSALRNLEQIKTLEIWRPTILDVQALKELAQLKKIVIEDIDEISSESLARLKSELPHCTIIDDLDDW